MKRRNMLLMGTLMVTMAVSPVFAGENTTNASEASEQAEEAAETEKVEEAAETEVSEQVEEASGGLLASLFGEGGPLEGVLPEGTDIDTMVSVANEQLNQAGTEIKGVLDEIIEKARSGAEGFSVDSLKEYAGEFLGQFMGGGDYGLGGLEELFRILDSIRGAEEQYILDRNAGLMDPADVQILSNASLYQDDFDQDEIRIMASMIQNNYKKDDEGRLLFVSAADDIVLFTHRKDEDGNYPVMDALFAEDGEGYMASIEAMCGEVGEPVDECMESIEFDRVSVLYDLVQYLDEHPEIKGIEYEGEIRTAEELDELWNVKLNELYGELEEETPEEDEQA